MKTIAITLTADQMHQTHRALEMRIKYLECHLAGPENAGTIILRDALDVSRQALELVEA